MPVLVVGAGPTGLATAIGLRQAGVPARIVDAASGPATTSRALGVQPRGVEVLNRLGALGDLPQRGIPLTGVVINVDGRPIARLNTGAVTPRVQRRGVLISQAELEAGLRRRLAELGGAVEWGQEITDLDHDGWIVGADGAHSRIRKLAGIGFPGVPLIERFLVADVRADWALPRDAVTTWLGDTMLGVFPLPGDHLWRVLTPVAEDSDPDVSALVAARAGLPPIRSAEWKSYFRIHRRLAEAYRAGKVFLAGDAAHIHSPLGGQGLNTGLGDAENLAWKLALVERGRASGELLDTYQAERRPIATGVLGTTSDMTRMMLGRTALQRLVRDHVVVPLMDRPFVQRLIAEKSSQLQVSYRGGPLGESRWGRAPRSGDRVPDGDYRRADGTPARLHDELCGRWALLTSDDEAVRVARRFLGDEALVVLRSSTTMLVRPDAHLAARGPADRLERWLSAALGVPAPAAHEVAA